MTNNSLAVADRDGVNPLNIAPIETNPTGEPGTGDRECGIGAIGQLEVS
jgi:hypothetical protein